MGLKSKEAFYGFCYEQVQGLTPLAHLANIILEEGLQGKDSTRGHVFQAIGATQAFLAAHPAHRRTLLQATATAAYDLPADRKMLTDWKQWFASQPKGPYARAAFGYNLHTLQGYLTPTLGGTRAGGGGGDDEFKKVLRMAAEMP